MRIYRGGGQKNPVFPNRFSESESIEKTVDYGVIDHTEHEYQGFTREFPRVAEIFAQLWAPTIVLNLAENYYTYVLKYVDYECAFSFAKLYEYLAKLHKKLGFSNVFTYFVFVT